MAKKPTTFSMRMPEDLNEKIQAYAAEHNCTKAEAMSHFARAGIELEENGGAQLAQSAQSGDADASAEALAKIQERLEALQKLPTIEPSPTTAIVPTDIRDAIQAYSTQHECSEQEALTYYARIGVQFSAENHPASAKEVAELARRLDVLAQDGQQKSDQLKQMTDLLVSIRDYTKPDELELEGELADQDAEDVQDEELSDEERQRIADEHTRQIVSDVMDGYMERQKEEREAERARNATEAAHMQPQQTNPLNIWLPVLVAVIVSLIIGLILVVTR